MKYLLSLALTTLLSLQLIAQPGAVTNAILYHKDGELDKARTEIDQAVQHEKTKTNPEAWYYRGAIYEAIAYSNKPEYKSLTADAATEAYTSFGKAMELDEKKSKYYKLSSEKLPNLYPAFINKGYGEYETGNFEKAVTSFEMAQKLNPNDTTGYLYAMYAAEELKNYDLIKKYIVALGNINYKSAYLTYNLIHITYEIDKDVNKALELSNKALEDFPGTPMLLEQQTNLYILSNRKVEAIENLQKLYKINPKDITVLTQLGVIYDKDNQEDKALEYYKQALAIEPDNYVSNFNSAVIYYEKGIHSNEKLSKMSMNSDLTEKKKTEAEAESNFSASLEFANKALTKSEDPNDTKNIQLLINEVNKVLKK